MLNIPELLAPKANWYSDEEEEAFFLNKGGMWWSDQVV
jgi:hypothetical protein